MGVTRSALQLQASRLIQTVLALVCSIIVARSLGPAGSGAYATLIGFAVLAQAVTSFGFEDLTLARGPLLGGDSSQARGLYTAVARIRVAVVFGVSAVAAACLVGLTPDPFFGGHAALAWALAYAGSNSIATLGAVIQASRIKAARSALLDAVWGAGVTATYIGLLVCGQMTLSGALFVQAAWQALVDIGYVALIWPLRRGRDRSVTPFKGRDIFVFWCNGLLSLATGKTTDVLCMKVAGAPSSPIGEYNSAYNANQTANQVLLQGAGTMLYVNLGNVFRGGDENATRTAWTQSTSIAILLSVPICIYCMVMPQTILSLLYGSAFDPGASAMVWLAATSAVGRIFGGGSNQSLLFITGRQTAVLTVRTLSVVLNIAMDILMWKLFGIAGVAAASGCCSLLITVCEYLLANRAIALPIPWLTSLRMALPFVATAIGASLLVGPGSHKSLVLLTILMSFGIGVVLLTITRPLTAVLIPDHLPQRARKLLLLIARDAR